MPLEDLHNSVFVSSPDFFLQQIEILYSETPKNVVNGESETMLDDHTKELIDSYVAKHIDLYKASVNSEIQSLSEQVEELKLAVRKLNNVCDQMSDSKEGKESVPEKEKISDSSRN
ncbi:hypothetical protein FSP39_003374 [Pinctada imbricata]|uniref:Uncharacterized protein n=1 Tax=Pinctada imbricata TaxID=66713 RepID=A0AA88XPJ7_PINIB|nr:hypothetical protein FSP39_003374 [Pinctada imbricata]